MQVSYTNIYTGKYLTHARHSYNNFFFRSLCFFIHSRIGMNRPWRIYIYIQTCRAKETEGKREEQLSIVTEGKKRTHETGQEWNEKLSTKRNRKRNTVVPYWHTFQIHRHTDIETHTHTHVYITTNKPTYIAKLSLWNRNKAKQSRWNGETKRGLYWLKKKQIRLKLHSMY